jgi:hypothetical protein
MGLRDEEQLSPKGSDLEKSENQTDFPIREAD